MKNQFILLQCEQMTSQLEVAYIRSNPANSTETVALKRTIMLNIGCGCIQKLPKQFWQYGSFNVTE